MVKNESNLSVDSEDDKINQKGVDKWTKVWGLTKKIKVSEKRKEKFLKKKSPNKVCENSLDEYLKTDNQSQKENLLKGWDRNVAKVKKLGESLTLKNWLNLGFGYVKNKKIKKNLQK